MFGKSGLQVAIAVAILLANLQGPKLTIIFGIQTSLGVIFYSTMFFATIVDFTPRFIIGSLVAYYISQSFDVWAYHRIRQRTGERWLWLRNNLSTMSSQLLDTAIYSLVTWWGIVDLKTTLQLGAAKYLFKVIIAGIDTAFLYWAKASYRRRDPELPAAA